MRLCSKYCGELPLSYISNAKIVVFSVLMLLLDKIHCFRRNIILYVKTTKPGSFIHKQKYLMKD